jgi:hypothetical protein
VISGLVCLFYVHLEERIYERETCDEQPYRSSLDQSWFSGLQDLTVRDAHRVFRDGAVRVVHFNAPGDAYVAVIEPTHFITVCVGQLVIRREERDRVEAEQGSDGNSVANGIAFQHDDEFRDVRLGELRVTFGRFQAAVLKRLYEVSGSGDGWCFGKTLLAEVGSATKRMSDHNKPQPVWTSYIESDGRGR